MSEWIRIGFLEEVKLQFGIKGIVTISRQAIIVLMMILMMVMTMIVIIITMLIMIKID